MAQTYYDILYKHPITHAFEAYKYVEDLAQTLCSKGLLKIDAEIMRNFVRYTDPASGKSAIFGVRELGKQQNMPKVVEKLINLSNESLSQNKLQNIIGHLRYEMNKFGHIPLEYELKLARMLVQSAHPAIIGLIIHENVDIFITYGYEVGDVLDVYNWNKHGSNSGMQSTDMHQATIYVAVGGNPMLENSEDKNDGINAIKRMMIIAAQEIAHFGDIIRSKSGYYLDRHSMDWQRFRPKSHVRQARAQDLSKLKNFEKKINIMGLKDLTLYEEKLRTVEKYQKNSFTHRYMQIKIYIMRFIFINRAYTKNMMFIAFIKDKNIAAYLNKMITDMEFNLNPQADVYKKDDPEQEEAIACAEALARIPQQELKWGKRAVKYLAPNLYKIFYHDLIPACVIAYENASGEKYKIDYKKPSFVTIQRWIFNLQKKMMQYFKK